MSRGLGDVYKRQISNSEGLSTALVTINISDNPGSEFSLTATKRRDKGVWYVDLAWSNGSGQGTVQITLNADTVIADSAPNNGAYTDSVGKKPSGPYQYQVCESLSGGCASASVSF